MTYFLFWIGFSLIVGLIGKDRKIGFGMGLLWALLLSPLIGLIIVLVSPSMSGVKSPPKHRQYIEEAKKHEFKEDYPAAINSYMDALYHLENDFANKKLSRQHAEKRKIMILKIKDKIDELKKL